MTEWHSPGCIFHRDPQWSSSRSRWWFPLPPCGQALGIASLPETTRSLHHFDLSRNHSSSALEQSRVDVRKWNQLDERKPTLCTSHGTGEEDIDYMHWVRLFFFLWKSCLCAPPIGLLPGCWSSSDIVSAPRSGNEQLSVASDDP